MGFLHRVSGSSSSSVALSRSSTDSSYTAETSDTSQNSILPSTPLPRSSSASSLRAFFTRPKEFIFPPPAVFYSASTSTTVDYKERESFERTASPSTLTGNFQRRKQRSQSFNVLSSSSGTEIWTSPDLAASRSQSDFIMDLAHSERVSSSSRRNSLASTTPTNQSRDHSVDSHPSIRRERSRSIEANGGTLTPSSINQKHLSPLQEFRRSSSSIRPFPVRSNTAPPISPTQISRIASSRPVSLARCWSKAESADNENDQREDEDEEEDESDGGFSSKTSRRLRMGMNSGSSASLSSAGFRTESPMGRSLQGRRALGTRALGTRAYAPAVVPFTHTPGNSPSIAFPMTEEEPMPTPTTATSSASSSTILLQPAFKPRSRRTLSLPFQPHLVPSLSTPTLSSTPTTTPSPYFSRPANLSLKGTLPETATSYIPSSAGMASLSTFSSWDFPPVRRAESLAAKHKVLSPLESYHFPNVSITTITRSISSTVQTARSLPNTLMVPPPAPSPRSTLRPPLASPFTQLNNKPQRPSLQTSATSPTIHHHLSPASSSSSSSPMRTALQRSNTFVNLTLSSGPPAVPPRHPHRAKLRNPQSYSLQNCKPTSGTVDPYPSPYPYPAIPHPNRRPSSPSGSSDPGTSDGGAPVFGLSNGEPKRDRRGSHSSFSSLRREILPFERPDEVGPVDGLFAKGAVARPEMGRRRLTGEGEGDERTNVQRSGMGLRFAGLMGFRRREVVVGEGVKSLGEEESQRGVDEEEDEEEFCSFGNM